MVSERLSRILRIGCVNSGLFDSLDINADVAAIHLVGDNNTGKTSIIQLLQFLYEFRVGVKELQKVVGPLRGGCVPEPARCGRGRLRSCGWQCLEPTATPH